MPVAGAFIIRSADSILVIVPIVSVLTYFLVDPNQFGNVIVQRRSRTPQVGAIDLPQDESPGDSGRVPGQIL